MKPCYAVALAVVGWYLMLPPEPILPNPANSGKSTADLLEENERAWNWIRSGHHDPNEPTPIRPYIIGALTTMRRFPNGKPWTLLIPPLHVRPG